MTARCDKVCICLEDDVERPAPAGLYDAATEVIRTALLVAQTVFVTPSLLPIAAAIQRSMVGAHPDIEPPIDLRRRDELIGKSGMVEERRHASLGTLVPTSSWKTDNAQDPAFLFLQSIASFQADDLWRISDSEAVLPHSVDLFIAMTAPRTAKLGDIAWRSSETLFFSDFTPDLRRDLRDKAIGLGVDWLSEHVSDLDLRGRPLPYDLLLQLFIVKPWEKWTRYDPTRGIRHE
ncbi:hypothetical protein [Hwanghaeella sp.]|uniref:hypothetical protein n=1 Tax=Hwanghaeella sp. TaxID=2605943 RepID=UPI003CCC2A96